MSCDEHLSDLTVPSTMASIIGFVSRIWNMYYPPQPAKKDGAIRIGLLGASNIAWVTRQSSEGFQLTLAQTDSCHPAREITPRSACCCGCCPRRQEGRSICAETRGPDCPQIVSRLVLCGMGLEVCLTGPQMSLTTRNRRNIHWAP